MAAVDPLCQTVIVPVSRGSFHVLTSLSVFRCSIEQMFENRHNVASLF